MACWHPIFRWGSGAKAFPEFYDTIQLWNIVSVNEAFHSKNNTVHYRQSYADINLQIMRKHSESVKQAAGQDLKQLVSPRRCPLAELRGKCARPNFWQFGWAILQPAWARKRLWNIRCAEINNTRDKLLNSVPHKINLCHFLSLALNWKKKGRAIAYTQTQLGPLCLNM